MAKILDKMLNLVGWEEDDDREDFEYQDSNSPRDSYSKHNFFQTESKKQNNKVVNIRSSQNFKVVVMQPENFDDAQEICDHLKANKPVVINLEQLEKEFGQRILDFLSGAVYALDGTIQKVSTSIFIIAPNNVDIHNEFKEELKNTGVFPWAK